MSLFHRIFTTFFALVTFTGCLAPVDDPNDLDSSDGGEPMKNLVRSQITELLTTRNLLGSFEGDKIPNLQQDNLEPGEYTLQFQVIEPPIDGLGFATYAYIVWKVAGQQNSRIVSVFNGSAVSGVADSVHVQLLDQSSRGPVSLVGTFAVTNGLPTFTATNPQVLKSGEIIIFSNQPTVQYQVPNGMNGVNGVLDRPFTGATAGAVTAYALSKYKVGVTLSRGTRPTTMQPPVLLIRPSALVAATGFLDIPFPPDDAGVLSLFATVTTVITPQAATANGAIRILDAAGSILAGFNPSQVSTWYPIPPGARTLRLINDDLVQDLIFSIQWGIEG